MNANRFRRTFFFTLLIQLLCLPLPGQSLDWESVEPDFFTHPDFSGSYGGLTGIDGYFYIWISISQNPSYTLLRSADGVTWQEVGPGTRCEKGFTLSSGKVLLYGFSDDLVIGQGDSWQVSQLAPDNNAEINGAIEGDDRIVLCGQVISRRQVNPAWWVSTDGGDTFAFYSDSGSANSQTSSQSMETIAYANGTFVMGGLFGSVWTSADGVTWTPHALPTVAINNVQQPVQLLDITYANGAFYGVGSYASLFTSTDGINWELLIHDSSAGQYNYLDKILIDGDNGYGAGPSGDMVWSADGGLTWESYSRFENLSDLTGGNGVYYGGRYIVPGGGPISPERDLGLEFWEVFTTREIAYTQGKWFVIESIGQSSYFGAPDTSNLGFLDSATTTDGVYFQHPWFGWYTLRAGDWAYHFNMGWIYSASASNANVWIYNSDFDWIFTAESLWPYFYHLASGNWVLYAGGAEWFWNETQQKWMQRGDFKNTPGR